MRILLVLSIALITVSGYKTFAHDRSDVISFWAATSMTTPNTLFFILKKEFSRDMVQLVNSVSVVNNVRKGVRRGEIFFDAVDVDGKVHNNIYCSVEYFYQQIGDCNYRVLSFSDCGNRKIVFKNKVHD